ncbi:hypothetical protein ACWIG5_40505, partial [Streptomyces lydicus]
RGPVDDLLVFVMLGTGQAAADDFGIPGLPPGIDPGDLQGTLPAVGGEMASQMLDPGQQAALNDAIGVAGTVGGYTPAAGDINAAIDAFRGGGAPQPLYFGPGIVPAVAPAGAENAPGAVAAPIADLAATVAQITGGGMPLEQLAAWADQTFPSGPMRGPVDDLLVFVEQATQMAGTRRSTATPAIDDLINQAKTLFGFPKDGPDSVQGLRDLLTGTTAAQQDPASQQLPPGLLAVAAPLLGLFAPQLGGMTPALALIVPLLAMASNPAAAIGVVFTQLRDAVRGMVSDARHPAALGLLALPAIALLAVVPLAIVGGLGVAAVLTLGAVVLGAILLAPLVIGALVVGAIVLAVLAIPVLIVLAVIAIPVLLIAIPVALVAFTVLAPVILVGGIAAIAVATV